MVELSIRGRKLGGKVTSWFRKVGKFWLERFDDAMHDPLLCFGFPTRGSHCSPFDTRDHTVDLPRVWIRSVDPYWDLKCGLLIPKLRAGFRWLIQDFSLRKFPKLLLAATQVDSVSHPDAPHKNTEQQNHYVINYWHCLSQSRYVQEHNTKRSDLFLPWGW